MSDKPSVTIIYHEAPKASCLETGFSLLLIIVIACIFYFGG